MARGATQDFHLILDSRSDRKSPYSPTSCWQFENSIDAKFKQFNQVQVQINSLFCNRSLPPFQIEIGGTHCYFFGSIHQGKHNHLHVGTRSVKADTQHVVENPSFFNVRLSDISSWRICIRQRGGRPLPVDAEAYVVLEMTLRARPDKDVSRFLYFDNNTLTLPSPLHIKQGCQAALISFQHSHLANIYPPWNFINIRIGEGDNWTRTRISIPTDFYDSAEKFRRVINPRIVKYGLEFVNGGGSLSLERRAVPSYSGIQMMLEAPSELASQIGMPGSHEHHDMCIIGVGQKFYHFDPLHSLPKIMMLTCSMVDKDNIGNNRILRLLYRNPSSNSHDHQFLQKQFCSLEIGYHSEITVQLCEYPSQTPVYFAGDNSIKFIGCLELVNH